MYVRMHMCLHVPVWQVHQCVCAENAYAKWRTFLAIIIRNITHLLQKNLSGSSPLG